MEVVGGRAPLALERKGRAQTVYSFISLFCMYLFSLVCTREPGCLYVGFFQASLPDLLDARAGE
jgi:hypothetical protein